MLKRLFLIGLFVVGVVAAAGADKRKFVLVIDAGHGGHDAGAVGSVSKEKNLTLKYALAFGQMVERNCPDVSVVYTRKTDRFLELWQRAEIANKHKADLFISIHINSLPKGKVARGFQTYTLGRSRTTGSGKGYIENLQVAKRENAVILLEKDYKQRYQGYDPNSPESDIMFEFIQDDNMERSVELAKLMQRNVCAATGRRDMGAHQDNLAVLRLTSMPGCLIELGFISTKDEEAFMNSKDGTDKYARGIYNAFVAYKKARGWAGVTKVGDVQQPKPDQQSAKPDAQPVQQEKSKKPQTADSAVSSSQPAAVTPLMQTPAEPSGLPVFKVQFMTSDRQIREGNRLLKGLTGIDCYKEGGMWKYTVGASTNYNEIYRLRKEVVQKFPQAFIIAFKDGEKVDVQAAIQEFKRNKTK